MKRTVASLLLGFALTAPAQQSGSPGERSDANEFVFADGSTMSRAEVTRRLLDSNQVVPRDSGGNAVDSRTVIVREDGTVTASDGRPVKLFVVAPSIQPVAAGGAPGGAATTGSGSQRATPSRDARATSSGSGGIPIIQGGNGKDGAAQVGKIPILD